MAKTACRFEGHNSSQFRDHLLTQPLNIQAQVAATGGSVSVPQGPGLGVEPDRDFIRHYTV